MARVSGWGVGNMVVESLGASFIMLPKITQEDKYLQNPENG